MSQLRTKLNLAKLGFIRKIWPKWLYKIDSREEQSAKGLTDKVVIVATPVFHEPKSETRDRFYKPMFWPKTFLPQIWDKFTTQKQHIYKFIRLLWTALF
jgi:hypothetical protein